mmetsp:Transcript_15031/g.14615  ORF Transcript_15031/g.14615 Transcript_15031/m.14615 type:complete len:86 (-) Transcript_15031:156-413(-)
MKIRMCRRNTKQVNSEKVTNRFDNDWSNQSNFFGGHSITIDQDAQNGYDSEERKLTSFTSPTKSTRPPQVSINEENHKSKKQQFA